MLASVIMTGYLTAEAFVEWALYPISTTTETFPITDVHFPNIVVCPPKVAERFRFYNIFENIIKQDGTDL